MEPTKERADESDSSGPGEMVEAGAVVSNTRVDIVDGKPVFKPTRGFLLAFSALMVMSLAIAFDATSLSVALPIISIELGGTALEAFWSGTGFLLASTVLQPTFAGLSHIFGRKNVSVGPRSRPREETDNSTPTADLPGHHSFRGRLHHRRRGSQLHGDPRRTGHPRHRRRRHDGPCRGG